MTCYFQGCARKPTTKEHIPPRAFFPLDKRDQLLTVPSCEAHNNQKTEDDLYVLAHICLNASPAEGSRDLFRKRVLPQLAFNEGALRKALARDAVPLVNGAVAYPVKLTRFDSFFNALACGLTYKSSRLALPSDYSIAHIYHQFLDLSASEEEKETHRQLAAFYQGELAREVLDFGQVKTANATIYSARIFGLPGYASSITITHCFFGIFNVTSMLTRTVDEPTGLERDPLA